ncbi:MAG: sialate O-acetylesterase [Candidatus Omnitrophota bacterium]|nr:MAG: sialate O-acetylesterase [Candidatus Omnitrophota bacterium]
MKQWVCLIGFSALILLVGTVAYADIRPHALFSDGMVLQQGMETPIWGTADDGETVTVEFRGQTQSVKANDGKWMVRLPPTKAGGPFSLSIRGKNGIEIKNVLVGEVWICSGQSNMQWPVRASNNPDEEIANADYPQIRLFTVPRIVAGKPQENVDAKWGECSPQTIGDFSAVAYYFGRELFKKMNMPIGLIHTSWGGTPAESWTTRETLASEADYQPILDRWNQSYDKFENDVREYAAKLEDWLKETDQMDREGKIVSDFPKLPQDPRRHPWRPAGLFNAMISPLIPYAIQGAIWYQGESNADRAYQYRTLFPAMITDWRREWKQGDFPFLFVQLANFEYKTTKENAWPELREAQTMTLSLPKTGMAVTIDIGDANDIHPKNKQDVGKRLALAAEKIAYGHDIVYSGPLYDSMSIDNRNIRLRFQHVGGGLMTPDGQPLKGFEIAAEDQQFVPADARIDGNTVLVSHDAIEKPVAVRYAWKKNPDCNLFNKEGLPASPFRTDDWPGITIEER